MCYRKADPPEVTEIVDLKDHVSKLDNSFFLVDTKQKRNTKELVAGVNKMKENEPAQFDELICTLRDTSEGILEIIEEPVIDKYALWDQISMSQQYLQELGVSSTEIDKVVGICMEEEAHAKLTGAGGGAVPGGN